MGPTSDLFNVEKVAGLAVPTHGSFYEAKDLVGFILTVEFHDRSLHTVIPTSLVLLTCCGWFNFSLG